MGAGKARWSDYPDQDPEERGDVERMPSRSHLSSLTEALFSEKQARPYQYLMGERRLSPKVVKRCGIGWDARTDAYTIPLHDEDDELVNVKWWRPEWSQQAKKHGAKDCFYVKGRRWLVLFPKSDLSRARDRLVLVTEGEVDAMTALSYGFAAVSATGGAGKWDVTWGPLFAGLDVVITPDLDPDGTKHMKVVTASILPHANSLRVLNWRDLL